MTLKPGTKELMRAQQFVDQGRFAELIAYLDTVSSETVHESTNLSLFRGIAEARLGRMDVGREWVERALKRANLSGDMTLRTRALNVLGAIAFESGDMMDAQCRFSQGLEAAYRDEDYLNLGRCANNLANIHYVLGHLDTAEGYYRTALVSFERSFRAQGLAEAWHNLATIFRIKQDFESSREAQDRAVEKAVDSGDEALIGQAFAGRAEIRAEVGDLAVAEFEVDHAIRIHTKIEDGVRVTEDRRIQAKIDHLLGRFDPAIETLLAVAEKAEEFSRPWLLASARRDLAAIYRSRGDEAAALDQIRSARAVFSRIGAQGEVARLDAQLQTN